MATCKLGEKGCWQDGKCHYRNDCENKVLTNADRIRSMSDEELEKFICSMFKCEFCDFELGERCGLLNWLQMPAEEVDNETVGERKGGDGNG